MPMIDVYARTGTFRDTHTLARDLATAVMTVERVPDIPMFRENTAAFVHELPATSISNVNGDSTYVRVQVLTNAGALDRDKQLAVVAQLTSIVADAAGDPSPRRPHMGAAHRSARRWLGPARTRQHERGARRGGSGTDRRTRGSRLEELKPGSVAASATGSPAAFATSRPGHELDPPGLRPSR